LLHRATHWLSSSFVCMEALEGYRIQISANI
jgi:hypothetical protein